MKNQAIASNEEFHILDFWDRNKHYWPWFIVSLVLCLGFALLFILITPDSYERNASVMIKEDSNMTDISAAFSNRDYFKSNTNVNNEIAAFESPHLLQEVIERLDLTINYKTRKGLKEIDLYGQSPIIATFPDLSEYESFSFCAGLLPDSVIVLSEFEYNKVKIDQKVNAKLNERVYTPIGNVKVSPTLFYSPGQYSVPIKVKKHSIKEITEEYNKLFEVSLTNKESSIITLTLTDESVQRADDILDMIISVYNEKWVSYQNTVAVNTSRFISERLPIIEQELGNIDDHMEQYKRKNLLTNTQSAASLYLQESSEYSGRIMDVTHQVSIAEYIKEYLTDNSKVADLLPTNTGLNSTAIESQISQYNTLLLKRNELITNSSEKNPVIVDMNNSLKSTRQSIIHTIDNLIVTLNMQLESLKGQEARMTKNIASNPGQEKYLLSVEREQKIKESLYLYLLQKREENDMTLAMATTNTRIISPPSGSIKPVKPKKLFMLLVAFIIGIGLPGGIVWGKDVLNKTIRSKKDLNFLTVPFLGTIPENAQKKKKNNGLLMQDKGHDIINESFRMIRTNIDFMCSDDMKIIMFSSFETGSGKTFTAMNLSMSFAFAGKKVILLDLDMRTATLSGFVPSADKGISSYLNREQVFIKKDYFYPGFDIIPVGNIPPNPAELLMNGQLAILLDKLRADYDYVFIDCTPVDMVADATIVGKLADMTIFIVREGVTDRNKLVDLEAMHSNNKFKNISVILNGFSHERSSKYNAYYNDKIKDMTLLRKISKSTVYAKDS